ncbi:MAG: hypothetical protein KJ709_01865 [Nanoarchaeota archaeon]|nr:hypothetical protein [Nanoarchaeota archaeon]
MFIKGYKSLSHKALIDYIKQEHGDDFSTGEIFLMDRLRILRNKVVYDGQEISPNFIRMNRGKIENMIRILNRLCKKRLD